ncbi:(1-_4)-alpha-D-glucan 1-alpha-D-glucosylmutase [Sphingomonas zeicaulis]|uniref:malto-oligosyltrehalose synthase n=1 Tax=Sphingomonas zeicaulis TaxID=1632740 RepID=UPI003D1EB4D7
MIPSATYRIQFHKDFPFAAAADLADYLADLGISHLYASPIGTARAGSTHGYDVVDPTAINPELGGEDGFRALAATLRARGIGIILDIVPNHMAVGGADNRWWLDVLEQGPASAYARFFDIDWEPPGKLLAPFLGVPYGQALTSGALALDSAGAAVIAHDAHRFPLRPEDQLALRGEEERGTLYDGRTAEGANRLHALLERQHYRLAWWRTAADEINWRRFFDITELAGLRVEDEAVFEAVHALPLRLYAEGLIDGVRVDHVDGLADPGAYCRRLRAALDAARPEPGYFVVEKILGTHEALPADWATDGTSGYDFMDQVSALLHAPAAEVPLATHWAALSERSADFAEEEHQARHEILERTFPGQLNAAVAAFHGIARADPATRDVTAGMIRRAMTGLLVHFPAYRAYGQKDRLARVAAAARADAAPGEGAMVDQLIGWMTAGTPQAADALRRFEQLSAPLAAKAVEDTAFYRYGRLLSRNDVGFHAARLSLEPADFLADAAARQRHFPAAMLTTATHDHKRGEDVRARLAVISERPEAWIAAASDWLRHPLAAEIDPADAYQILQTIVGAWPLDGGQLGDFGPRVSAWSMKALREAKLRSSWTAPDEPYEAACASFITGLLADPALSADLAGFVERIAPAGALNGIVQAVLRCTVPGVPDCYQGTDLWDFSLVDPDNRRPVDYDTRQLVASFADMPAHLADWRSGRAKQAVIAHLLNLRRSNPALFTTGALEPVSVTGERADHVLAFARSDGAARLLVAVPIRCATAVRAEPALAIDPEWWGDTAIEAGGESLPVRALFAETPFAIRATGF